jgi:rubrerythrin
MDKFVKLEAIERIAKPMASFHGKGKMHGKEDYAEGGKDWECPDCGTMVMATKDTEEMECPCCGCEMEPAEDTEADVEEDAAEGETEED